MGTGARALNRFVERSLDDVDWQPLELMARGVKRIVISAATVAREQKAELVQEGAPTEEAALSALRRKALYPGPGAAKGVSG